MQAAFCSFWDSAPVTTKNITSFTRLAPWLNPVVFVLQDLIKPSTIVAGHTEDSSGTFHKHSTKTISNH